VFNVSIFGCEEHGIVPKYRNIGQMTQATSFRSYLWSKARTRNKIHVVKTVNLSTKFKVDSYNGSKDRHCVQKKWYSDFATRKSADLREDRWSRTRVPLFYWILWKSVKWFLRNLANRQTNKQTNRL